MMRKLVLAFLLLAGCHSERDKAVQDVNFLEAHHAAIDELCDAYTKVVTADLKEHDSKDWDMDREMQSNTCLIAQLRARNDASD